MITCFRLGHAAHAHVIFGDSIRTAHLPLYRNTRLPVALEHFSEIKFKLIILIFEWVLNFQSMRAIVMTE